MKTIYEILEILKIHHQTTYDHSKRVANLALLLARKLNLSNYQQRSIYLSGLLHDIGKLYVDVSILNKTKKLTALEWKVIKDHTICGYQLIQKFDHFRDFGYCILFHHERSDGSGYPFGLKKHQIPLDSQIVAVVDSFDSMTENRGYNQLKCKEEALIDLKEHAEKLYCPQLIKAFEEVLQHQKKPNIE